MKWVFQESQRGVYFTSHYLYGLCRSLESPSRSWSGSRKPLKGSPTKRTTLGNSLDLIAISLANFVWNSLSCDWRKFGVSRMITLRQSLTIIWTNASYSNWSANRCSIVTTHLLWRSRRKISWRGWPSSLPRQQKNATFRATCLVVKSSTWNYTCCWWAVLLIEQIWLVVVSCSLLSLSCVCFYRNRLTCRHD